MCIRDRGTKSGAARGVNLLEAGGPRASEIAPRGRTLNCAAPNDRIFRPRKPRPAGSVSF
eukprot:4776744-Alexandrium_andersonii.AAC.1